MKPIQQLALGIASLLLLPAIVAVNVRATANSPNSPAQLTAQSIQPMPRRRRPVIWRVGVRPSLYRIGGFSRSASCPSLAKVIAFVPPPRSEEKIGTQDRAVDITASGHPTFWVYVSGLPQNTEVKFTLEDKDVTVKDREIYNTKFSLSEKTGILGVQLPKTKPELKVGRTYLWQMLIKCDRASASLKVGSWVQRLNPEQIKPATGFEPKPLVRKLAQASNRDKPALYASLGVW